MINPEGINRKKLVPFVLLIIKNGLYEPVRKMNKDRSGQRIEPMYLDFCMRLKLRRLFYFTKSEIEDF